MKSPNALPEMDAYCTARLRQIRATESVSLREGAVYYVSADGDDSGSGLSPETPWKTLKRVDKATLLPGDNVLFRRGDLFRGRFRAQEGVLYSAYGEGEKPRFYGWDYNLAEERLWQLYDDAHHIWKMKRPIADCGTLVFDDEKKHSRKLIPSFRNGQFVCRQQEEQPFDMAREMTKDLDIFCHCAAEMTARPSKGEDFPIPQLSDDTLGTLYLRCDAGNPGTVFSSIEALPRRHMIRVKDHVHVDNLCLKYIGMHAISGSGHIRGLHVSNCEIGWVGGCIQHYYGTDPNDPSGRRGTVTRFGNGVEIYGGCEDFRVENCYIYQVYDAAVTHQITTNGRRFSLKNIRYQNNLIERCVYGIEYFLDKTQGDTESMMTDCLISGNVLRLSGFGWGQQRHNTDTPALIKGWSFENTARDFYICNNVFDRCAYRLLHLVAREKDSCPILRGNTYIQSCGGLLGSYGANAAGEPEIRLFDDAAEQTICKEWGDHQAQVHCLHDENSLPV